MIAPVLACPFCGGKAESRPEGTDGYWRTGCQNIVTCGHRGPAMPSMQDSHEAWNRRVTDPTAEAESLRELLRQTTVISWRCFHCNYIARTREQAIEHFGLVMNERPAVCLIAGHDKAKEQT